MINSPLILKSVSLSTNVWDILSCQLCFFLSKIIHKKLNAKKILAIIYLKKLCNIDIFELFDSSTTFKFNNICPGVAPLKNQKNIGLKNKIGINIKKKLIL